MNKSSRLFLLFAFFIISLSSFAQWNADTINGGKISVAEKLRYNDLLSFSDGAGGVMHVFTQLVDSPLVGTFQAIKMQRCDSAGILQWGTADSGYKVESTSDALLDAVSDSAGGAYILYTLWDYAPPHVSDSFYLYIQHINKNGQPLWGQFGLQVDVQNAYKHYYAKLCPLSSQAIGIAWVLADYNDNYGQVYAQKITAGGSTLWNFRGVPACTAPEKRGAMNVVSDGNGGMILLFEDGRNSQLNGNGNYDDLDIYAQRISSNGTLAWGAAGIAIATGNSVYQNLPVENAASKYLLPDGAGGCYATFIIDPDGTDQLHDYYIQHLNASGQILWGTSGKFITRSEYLVGYITDTRMLPHPAGGVSLMYLVSRTESQSSGPGYLQLQSVDAAGSYRHAVNTGKLLAPATTGYEVNGLLYPFAACYTTAGELIFVFRDNDNASSVRMQKLDAAGLLAWDSSGKTIVRQTGEKIQLFSSGSGKYIVQWADGRNYAAVTDLRDIFLSRFDGAGNITAGRRIITSAGPGNWNNAATWQGGIVPGANDIVVIVHPVTVSANASCYSLTVQPPAGNITVLTGISLQVLH